MSKLLYNIQLFAESAAADTTGEGTVDAAQVETSTEDVVDTTEEVEDNAESFEDLIKGRFKKDFDQRVQSIVKSRLKDSAQLNERISKMNPIMEMLGSKYGVDATDIDKLTEAITNDDSYFEREAMERGMDVQTLKYVKGLEREQKQYVEREKEMQRREAWGGILRQAKELKEFYPDFDIESEMENKDFGMLIAANVPVKTAYEVIHAEELQPQMMRHVAEKTAEKVANSVKSNKSRPQEAAKGSQATTFKRDPKSLTVEEREEIYRRVMAGEDISF